MNKIEEAVKLLENNWCVGELKEDDADKYCAVGALAAVTNNMVFIKTDADKYIIDEDEVYEKMNKTEELRAVAQEIVESDIEMYWGNHKKDRMDIQGWYDDGDYAAVVYSFNDKQDSAEPVIEMFKHAAKRLD